MAPWPGPSLWASRAPPISRAPRAELWRPKPWPVLRVVKPWEKMRVRFSGGMPTPLSMTETRTVRPYTGNADGEYLSGGRTRRRRTSRCG